jgi:hypothetical protein
MAGRFVCADCGKIIVSDDDLVICDDCEAPFHADCFDALTDGCPICAEAAERPERPKGVFAATCSRCLRRNDPPEETCRGCGEPTYWNDIGVYREHFVVTKQLASVGLLKGAALAFAGLILYAGICFAMYFGYVASPRAGVWILLAAGVLLILDGMRRMRHAWRIMLIV